jgi:hypothetical protein
MKRTILITVLVLGLLSATIAAAGPVVDLKESSFDAGQVLQGQLVEGTYHIDNPGDAVLEIKKVSPG